MTKDAIAHHHHLDTDYVSDAIYIGCGDYRPSGVVMKYLKRKHKLRHMDDASTAGGSRTISLYGVKKKELKNFKIKQAALFLDVDAYIHHHATRCVISCHGLCAYWPEFDSLEEEFEAHCQSLLLAGKIMKEKYPQFEEIILLFVVLDENKPHRPIEIREISLDGSYKTTDLRTDPEMAPRQRHAQE